MGVIAGITAATTGLGIFTNAQAARQRNRAIRRSVESQARATEARQQQLAEQAAIERQRRINERQRTEGRLRVIAADAGIGTGGSIAALNRQAAYDASLDLFIQDRNLSNEIRRAGSQFEADATRLYSETSNPLLAGLTGGLGGVSTGLAIGGAIESYRDREREREGLP